MRQIEQPGGTLCRVSCNCRKGMFDFELRLNGFCFVGVIVPGETDELKVVAVLPQNIERRITNRARGPEIR
jgi:hypothetical protein